MKRSITILFLFTCSLFIWMSAEVIDLSTLTDNYEIKQAGDYKFQGNGAYQILVAENIVGDVGIVLNNVDLTPSSTGPAIVVGVGSIVNFEIEGENVIRGKDTGEAIQVIGEVNFSGTGSLDAKSRGYHPAIGSKETPVGVITFNSGSYLCRGGNECAAIGGGNGTIVNNIIINGGFIDAKSGVYGPGIGTGIYGKGAGDGNDTTKIVINGGTIISQADGASSGGKGAIGKGQAASSKIKVIVNGGSIKALSNSGDVIELEHPTAVNSEGIALKLFQRTLADVTEPTAIVSGSIGSIILGEDYGINDVVTEADGSLYFYLPEQTKDVEVILNGSKVEPDEEPAPPVGLNVHLKNTYDHTEKPLYIYSSDGTALSTSDDPISIFVISDGSANGLYNIQLYDSGKYLQCSSSSARLNSNSKNNLKLYRLTDSSISSSPWITGVRVFDATDDLDLSEQYIIVGVNDNDGKDCMISNESKSGGTLGGSSSLGYPDENTITYTSSSGFYNGPTSDYGLVWNLIQAPTVDVEAPTGSSIQVNNTSRGIVVKNAINTNVQIFTLSGQMVASKSIANDLQTIELLHSGLYIVKIGQETFKVVLN